MKKAESSGVLLRVEVKRDSTVKTNAIAEKYIFSKLRSFDSNVFLFLLLKAALGYKPEVKLKQVVKRLMITNKLKVFIVRSNKVLDTIKCTKVHYLKI